MRHRKVIAAAGAAVSVLLTISLVLFSPAFARWIVGNSASWNDLANVGQVYGGAAAVISALALTGIAASLYLQWRQTRLMQIFTLRERTFEIAKLGIEHPELLQMIAGSVPASEAQHAAYANLWMTHWATYWDLRLISEAALRQLVRPLFGDPRALSWWNTHAATWSVDANTHRRRFMAIVTDECELAMARDRIPRQRQGIETVDLVVRDPLR